MPTYVDLAVNSSYTYAVFGQAAYVFAIGGPARLDSGLPDQHVRRIDQETGQLGTLAVVTFLRRHLRG